MTNVDLLEVKRGHFLYETDLIAGSGDKPCSSFGTFGT